MQVIASFHPSLSVRGEESHPKRSDIVAQNTTDLKE